MLRVAIIEDDSELRKFMEETVGSCEDFILAGSYSTAEDFKKDFQRLSDLNVAVMDIAQVLEPVGRISIAIRGHFCHGRRRFDKATRADSDHFLEDMVGALNIFQRMPRIHKVKKVVGKR